MRSRVALLAATSVVLAGCGHTVTGAAVRDAGAGASLRAEDAGEVLISPVQVQQIIGQPLFVDADRTDPVAGSSVIPACSALDTVGMAAFVGDEFSGIRVVLLTNDRHDGMVAEAVAVYPDAATAADAFRAGTKDARACDGQRAAETVEAAWKFSVQDDNADTVRWTKQQLAIPLTWLCHGEGRLRNNAVLQVMVCRSDDDGQTVVTTLTDRMSAKVWELSGR